MTEQSERIKRALFKEYAQGIYDGSLSAMEAAVEALDESYFTGLNPQETVRAIRQGLQININRLLEEGPSTYEEVFNE